MSEQTPWWGEFHLNVGETMLRHVGPVKVWLARDTGAWHLAFSRSMEGEPDAATIPARVDHRCTFAMGHSPRRFRLEPRLADRPLIWRPESPLFVTPGEQISLFLTMPLWIGFYVDGIGTPLCEFPVHRLSDTWTGSPLEKGGYAYAAHRQFILEEYEVPADVVHATIPLRIRNASTAQLALQRINLPVPFLSLFLGERGFWTQRLTLERDAEDDELALLRLDKEPPDEAGAGELVSGPREQAEKHAVFQAFSRIFK